MYSTSVTYGRRGDFRFLDTRLLQQTQQGTCCSAAGASLRAALCAACAVGAEKSAFCWSYFDAFLPAVYAILAQQAAMKEIAFCRSKAVSKGDAKRVSYVYDMST